MAWPMRPLKARLVPRCAAPGKGVSSTGQGTRATKYPPIPLLADTSTCAMLGRAGLAPHATEGSGMTSARLRIGLPRSRPIALPVPEEMHASRGRALLKLRSKCACAAITPAIALLLLSSLAHATCGNDGAGFD